MILLLLIVCIGTIKVFKKSTPNGKVTVYLEKREFIDRVDHIDPVEGIVVVENDYLKGRKIFGQLATIYRYGREEDEVMGLKFSKELILSRGQIVPSTVDKENLTPVQERLIKKFSSNAYPFIFNFPVNAPSSVTLQQGEERITKPLGVAYSVKVLVAENDEDRGHKRSTVTLVVKKLQYAPVFKSRRFPSSLVSKDFTFGNGKLSLEVTLDKELYYHGEGLGINVVITNGSSKLVKSIKCYAVQHCEVTMINGQYSKYVASLETREGCPISPGSTFSKKFFLVPLASSNKNKYGIALDGYLKDDDIHLASSTLIERGKGPVDSLGIVISYSVRVKLYCGTLGGELITDVPFKLMQPAPGTAEEVKMKALNKAKSIERTPYENACLPDEEDDNVVLYI